MVEKAPVSQYDVVVDLCQQNIDLPDRILCLAGSGEKFHGNRRRSWAALPGNIHLTAHLKPDLLMSAHGIGFTIMSALAVVEAIDRLPGLSGRAMIKWVNDIFIDDAKVSGFLTHTLSLEGRITSAIIGIGLNVEIAPEIVPDRFIGRAAALKNFAPDTAECNQRIVFEYLTGTLQKNYSLLAEGQLPSLLDRYRERSLIIGRSVEIIPDSVHAVDDEVMRGRVTAIGPHLEIYLEGREAPVTRGRLILIS
jgi:BirA family biotin operon repressor/biotin-[acetyl-CoA-carboxylase] ligase